MTTWCRTVLQLGLHHQGMQHPACSSAGFYMRQPGILPSTVLDLNRNNTLGIWLIQEAQGPEALDWSSGFVAIFVVAALLGPADITRVLYTTSLPPPLSSSFLSCLHFFLQTSPVFSSWLCPSALHFPSFCYNSDFLPPNQIWLHRALSCDNLFHQIDQTSWPTPLSTPIWICCCD